MTISLTPPVHAGYSKLHTKMGTILAAAGYNLHGSGQTSSGAVKFIRDIGWYTTNIFFANCSQEEAMQEILRRVLPEGTPNFDFDGHEDLLSMKIEKHPRGKSATINYIDPTLKNLSFSFGRVAWRRVPKEGVTYVDIMHSCKGPGARIVLSNGSFKPRVKSSLFLREMLQRLRLNNFAVKPAPTLAAVAVSTAQIHASLSSSGAVKQSGSTQFLRGRGS